MIKKLLCICLLGAAPFIGKAQELNARITINSDKVQSTNKQVFKTLQDALNDFVNNKKWTDATFAMNERIDCSMYFPYIPTVRIRYSRKRVPYHDNSAT